MEATTPYRPHLAAARATLAVTAIRRVRNAVNAWRSVQITGLSAFLGC